MKGVNGESHGRNLYIQIISGVAIHKDDGAYILYMEREWKGGGPIPLKRACEFSDLLPGKKGNRPTGHVDMSHNWLAKLILFTWGRKRIGKIKAVLDGSFWRWGANKNVIIKRAHTTHPRQLYPNADCKLVLHQHNKLSQKQRWYVCVYIYIYTWVSALIWWLYVEIDVLVRGISDVNSSHSRSVKTKSSQGPSPLVMSHSVQNHKHTRLKPTQFFLGL